MGNKLVKNNIDSKRKNKVSSMVEETTTTKHSKQCLVDYSKYKSLVNLMNFVEISPINSTDIPRPRSGHRAVATESDFWIWGGFHPQERSQPPRMFDELWRFNYALRQWTLETTTGDKPHLTLASHSMCLYRNIVFVFGGTGFPFGQNVSDDLYMLDLNRRHWKRCQLPSQRPERVYGASMLIKNDHLYILCGTNSLHYNSDVYDIHLPTLTCTQIGYTFEEIEDPTDGGRYRQEAFLYDDKIFLFGGGGSSGVSFSLENLPVFDIKDRTWTFVRTNPDRIHNFPSARKFHSIFPFHKNQIIMFGGAYFDQTITNHAAVSGNLWIFDFEKLEWSMLSSLSMVKTTYFHAAALNNLGEIWSHGGVIQDPATFNNERRISTLYKMHSKVPKLSELSWNYFLNCLPDRTCLITQANLMTQLNIPTQFIERVH